MSPSLKLCQFRALEATEKSAEMNGSHMAKGS